MTLSNITNEPHIVTARVWQWKGDGAWHFITIEKEQGNEIKKDWHWPRRGFGSIPIEATLGTTTWNTSIFPEKGGTFVLPLKKAVREKEGVVVGKTITLSLTVLS